MTFSRRQLASFVVVVAVLLVGSSRAQQARPAEPAVAVLGEVDNHSVPVGENLTVFDAFFAAKVRPAADNENLLLVRCDGGGVLSLRIDIQKMLKTGVMSQNVLLQGGDLLFVPKRSVAAGTSDVDLVAAMVRDPGQCAQAQLAQVAAWRLLMEKDALRRHDCVTEFGKVAAAGGVMVEPLAAALERDVAIARDVATALGMLGTAGKPALPALAKAMERDDAQLRERAKAAVRQIEAAIAAQKAAEPPDKNEAGKSKE